MRADTLWFAPLGPLGFCTCMATAAVLMLPLPSLAWAHRATSVRCAAAAGTRMLYTTSCVFPPLALPLYCPRTLPEPSSREHAYACRAAAQTPRSAKWFGRLGLGHLGSVSSAATSPQRCAGGQAHEHTNR